MKTHRVQFIAHGVFTLPSGKKTDNWMRRMIMRAISNPELIKVLDAHTHKIYYGCNQECYNTEWQGRSGCAPAVAPNIILYLSHTQDIPRFEKNCSIKEKCVSVLEELWTFVTPTLAGIPSTRMFSDTVLAYAKANGLNVECFVYDVPDNKTSKPPLAEMVNFIKNAL
ncbi:MAG: hypothetical protein H6Q76_2677, partial [Firmicutes bacterium]|nr:hypothetical protein [Bacillota bacterium]